MMLNFIFSLLMASTMVFISSSSFAEVNQSQGSLSLDGLYSEDIQNEFESMFMDASKHFQGFIDLRQIANDLHLNQGINNRIIINEIILHDIVFDYIGILLYIEESHCTLYFVHNHESITKTSISNDLCKSFNDDINNMISIKQSLAFNPDYIEMGFLHCQISFFSVIDSSDQHSIAISCPREISLNQEDYKQYKLESNEIDFIIANKTLLDTLFDIYDLGRKKELNYD